MFLVKSLNEPEKIHKNLVDRMRSVQYTDTELSDRLLLKSVISNYRTGGGLKLSNYGYEFCVEHKLYDFVAVQIKGELVNESFIAVSLDRICNSPYYINRKCVYLTDAHIITLLTFYNDDFEFLFSTFS